MDEQVVFQGKNVDGLSNCKTSIIAHPSFSILHCSLRPCLIYSKMLTFPAESKHVTRKL